MRLLNCALILALFAVPCWGGMTSIGWSEASNATGYIVYKGTDATTQADLYCPIGGSALCTFLSEREVRMETPDCTTRCFHVVAVNGSGSSPPSPVLCGWPRPVITDVNDDVITGVNFQPGATLLVDGEPADDVAIVDCNTIIVSPTPTMSVQVFNTADADAQGGVPTSLPHYIPIIGPSDIFWINPGE